MHTFYIQYLVANLDNGLWSSTCNFFNQIHYYYYGDCNIENTKHIICLSKIWLGILLHKVYLWLTKIKYKAFS